MSLSVAASLSFRRDGVEETFSHQQTAAMSATGYKVQSPTIGTSVFSIATTEISTLGYSFLRSLVTTTQATCTITFGRMNGTAFFGQAVLRPGELAVLRLAPGNYAAQAAGEGYRLLLATVEE